ncbi:MAG: glycosyltransferase family 2 protein [Bauldia sp.]
MTALRDITVIIPARNAVASIGATLASLAAARDLIATVLLVDDASDDGTAAAARTAADASALPLTVIDGGGRGPGAARNRALERATSDFVFFIDADDQVLPGGLARMRSALAADPRLVLAIGSFLRRIPGQPDRVRRAQSYRRGAVGNARAYLSGRLRPVQIGAALARRSAVGAIRFPEAARYDEDTCFWAQLVAKGDAEGIADLVAVYNASPERMEARFIADPRRAFLDISRAYRRLSGGHLDPAAIAIRRSILALSVARIAVRHGDYRTAQRFLRRVGWEGLPLQVKYRRLRYDLRTRAALALAALGLGRRSAGAT